MGYCCEPPINLCTLFAGSRTDGDAARVRPAGHTLPRQVPLDLASAEHRTTPHVRDEGCAYPRLGYMCVSALSYFEFNLTILR